MKPARYVADFDSIMGMVDALGAFLHREDWRMVGIMPRALLFQHGVRSAGLVPVEEWRTLPRRVLDPLTALLVGMLRPVNHLAGEAPARVVVAHSEGTVERR